MLTLIKRIPTGRELTFAEVDNNFQLIEDAVNAVASGNGLPPYDAGYDYLGGVQYIVSYAGAIYTFISPTDVTGTTPGTNPVVWQLTNAGALLHQQGTDLFVGYGSAFQTSAEQLFNLANVRIITEAAFIALYNGNALKPNTVYAVTDCNLTPDAGDLPILYIHALSNSVVNSVCGMTLRMPDFSQDLFTLVKWNATSTFAATNKVCIDGLVYENLTGNNNATLLPADNPTDWQLKARSTSFYKVKKYGNVQIKITTSIEVDFFTDLATNTVYTGPDLQGKYLDSTGELNYSQARSILSSIGQVNRLTTVPCQNIFADASSEINVPIGGNFGMEDIFLKNSVIDFGGLFGYGNMVNIHLLNTILSFPDGHDSGVSNLKIEFAQQETINIALGLGMSISGTIDKHGSDVVFEGTMPATAALNLDLLCEDYSDVFGEFRLDTNTQTVTSIVRACRLFPIKIMPYGGNSITLQKTNAISATNNQIVGAANVTLDSSKSDYCILTPLTIDVGGGGVDVWQITEVVNNA